MQLTPHFSLHEFTASATARRLGIDNTPQEDHIAALRYLCEQLLEPLRNHVGHPIVINSGFRSPRLNAAVGGVKNSQHLRGEAADIRLDSRRQGEEYIDYIRQHLKFDQLILEHTSRGAFWLHVSCRRSGNRQTIIRLR